MRTGIAATVFATTFGLILALSSPASAKSEEQRVRSASVLRAKAAEMRDQANHLRDGEGVKKPNVPRAKELERKADQLRQQADKMDPQEWPPK